MMQLHCMPSANKPDSAQKGHNGSRISRRKNVTTWFLFPNLGGGGGCATAPPQCRRRRAGDLNSRGNCRVQPQLGPKTTAHWGGGGLLWVDLTPDKKTPFSCIRPPGDLPGKEALHRPQTLLDKMMQGSFEPSMSIRLSTLGGGAGILPCLLTLQKKAHSTEILKKTAK